VTDNADVNRWVGSWLRAWRSEPMVLESPLPAPAARERLIANSVPYLPFGLTSGDRGGLRVVGRVGPRQISLQAVDGGVRNSWRPSLRGRLEPLGTGSRFTGKLGWSPFVKAFSGLWLGGVGAIFLVLVIRAVAMARDGHATAEAFLVCLGPLGFVVFFIGLTTWGIRAGRREETYSRSWMADRLQTAEVGTGR